MNNLGCPILVKVLRRFLNCFPLVGKFLMERDVWRRSPYHLNLLMHHLHVPLYWRTLPRTLGLPMFPGHLGLKRGKSGLSNSQLFCKVEVIKFTSYTGLPSGLPSLACRTVLTSYAHARFRPSPAVLVGTQLGRGKRPATTRASSGSSASSLLSRWGSWNGNRDNTQLS